MTRLVEDEDDDPAYPEEDEDEDTTAPCPYCQSLIHEDAEWCPSCGKYLSREDSPYRKPWWLLAGVVVCLVLILGWVIG